MDFKCIYCFLVLLMCACTNTHTSKEKEKEEDNSSVSCSNGMISIDNVSKSTTLQIDCYDTQIQRETVRNSIVVDILSLIKQKITDHNSLALHIIKNKMILPVRVRLGNQIDTTLHIKYNVDISERIVSSINGNCAPLVLNENNPQNKVQAKRWLYQNKQFLDDQQVFKFVAIQNDLKKSKYQEYSTNERIPVIHSFTDVRYRVKSSLKADHYVLFAASEQKEIDSFIEEIISNDFELTVPNISSSMACYRELKSEGYKIICLIGINKNWTHSIVPLGIVAIDNTAPVSFCQGSDPIDILLQGQTSSNSSSEKSNDSNILLEQNILIKLPEEKPQIFGKCFINLVDWDGNGAECNASIQINFSGDIKKVIIHRQGSLAKWLSRKDFVYDLSKEIAPFSTSLKLHFDDGDNFIPISVYDNHGNVAKTKLKVTARFERVNTSDVNIENNIVN